jgi:hypothetical protein
VEDRQEIYRFRVAETAHEFRIPLKAKPSSVEIDPGGWVLDSISDTSY